MERVSARQYFSQFYSNALKTMNNRMVNRMRCRHWLIFFDEADASLRIVSSYPTAAIPHFCLGQSVSEDFFKILACVFVTQYRRMIDRQACDIELCIASYAATL